MILRAGVLEQDGRTSFCLARNISSTGIQVKLYGDQFVTGAANVRVADEPAVPGEIMWIRDGIAGIRFNERVEPATLLRIRQKLMPARRRSMPRIAANGRAAVRMGGRNFMAALCDISSMGAKVTTPRPLEVGAVALVRFAGLPEIRAYVRWSEGCDSGLVFETPIPMQVIAQWVDNPPLKRA
jgi:hypothetical protein